MGQLYTALFFIRYQVKRRPAQPCQPSFSTGQNRDKTETAINH